MANFFHRKTFKALKDISKVSKELLQALSIAGLLQRERERESWNSFHLIPPAK